MVDQAKAAGVSMREPDRTIIADPVLHDKSSKLFAPDGPAPTSSSEDRDVRGLPGGTQRQRRATIGGMSYADTVPFINYDSNPIGNVSGKVAMKACAQWLDAHGYGLNLTVN